MDLNGFKQNFPPGVEVPSYLVDLLEYQNRSLGLYSGYFKLIEEPYPEIQAFDGDENAARQFVHFASDPDGSTYAFWLYPGRTMETAPIVFQESEGTDWTVLADDLHSFFSLLALGEAELGRAASKGEYCGPQDYIEAVEEFRAWLHEKYRIVPAPDPKALVATAKSHHPDLDAWLEKWAEQHFKRL